MTRVHERLALPEPVQRAVIELIDAMRQQYPTAQFEVRRGTEDPEETFIMVTVDLEDPDEILAPILDRLLTMQLDDGLPIYVIPMHTRRRIAETRERIAALRPHREGVVAPATRRTRSADTRRG